MTKRQWVEWQIYVAKFLTPMRRADINSALERYERRKKKPETLSELIPPYGKRRRLPTQEEIVRKLKAGQQERAQIPLK